MHELDQRNINSILYNKHIPIRGRDSASETAYYCDHIQFEGKHFSDLTKNAVYLYKERHLRPVSARICN
jgi:hypothetical protein